LTILACLFALSVLKNKQSSEPGLKAAVQQETGERPNEAAARTIPKYITELSVELRSTGGYSQDSAHVIFIPVLGAKVGALDAEKVMRYIESNKELIRQKLEEKLVDAQYDELIKIDGEQYLKNMILKSIGDTTGTNKDPDSPLSNPEVLGQYGVVEILLPRSFSVH
jgi:hypothetical protein